MSQTERTGGNGIQVINRAANILRALRGEPGGLSLAQIATKVGLPRSTVQRIVGALASEGLLMAATPIGRVRIGTEIMALAAASKIDTVELAHPLIKALSEATGETVDLAVFKADHLVFVDQVVGSHRLRAVSAVGEGFPLHSTANGKASLAMMSDSEIRMILPRGLPALADGTLRSMDQLIREVGEIRRTGLAFDDEEHSLGISAVGTAFRDMTGSIYAISIPAPTGRFSTSRERLGAMLLKTRGKLADL